LLVSVARADEVADALAGGAEILDVKEPARGSLGRAEPSVLRAARSAAPPAIPVTAALGDTLPGPGRGLDALAARAAELARCGAGALKVGLAGTRDTTRARRALEELRARLAETDAPPVRLVAVVFADEPGRPIRPHDLPGVAAEAGLDGAMLDTLVKGRSILELLGERDLSAWIDDVRARGLFAGLAGSLRLSDLARAAALAPDLVGLRGAVCAGGRGGRVVAARVRRALRGLAGAPPAGQAESAPGLDEGTSENEDVRRRGEVAARGPGRLPWT
jgi:hypothetical protein